MNLKTGKSSGMAPTISRHLLPFALGPFSVSKGPKVMITGNNKVFKKWKCLKVASLDFRIGASALRKQRKQLQSMVPTGVHGNNKKFQMWKMPKDCFTWLQNMSCILRKLGKLYSALSTKHDPGEQWCSWLPNLAVQLVWNINN